MNHLTGLTENQRRALIGNVRGAQVCVSSLPPGSSSNGGYHVTVWLPAQNRRGLATMAAPCAHAFAPTITAAVAQAEVFRREFATRADLRRLPVAYDHRALNDMLCLRRNRFQCDTARLLSRMTRLFGLPKQWREIRCGAIAPMRCRALMRLRYSFDDLRP